MSSDVQNSDNFSSYQVKESSSSLSQQSRVSTSSEQSSNPISSKSNSSYVAYSGFWKASDNDPSGGKYDGTTLDIVIKSDNTISGTYHRSINNGGMLADADFTGKIASSGKGDASFSDDDRGHAGTISFTFKYNTIDTNLKYTNTTDSAGFGVRTGDVHFVKG